MDIRCVADFSDVDNFFQQGYEEVDLQVSATGEEAVQYARAHGNYKDISGKLRKSNHYSVEQGNLTLYNDAAGLQGELYAATMEAKGYDVLSGAALFAERNLKEKFER